MGAENEIPCQPQTQLELKINSSSSKTIPFRPRKIRKLSDPHSKDIAPPPPPPPPRARRPLTYPGELSDAISYLRSADPVLARVIDSHEPPSFVSSPSASQSHPPFHSLARSILYQQLATKAASSIYDRFISLCGSHRDGDVPILPSSVVSLSHQQLRNIGVSARKASYLHDLASKFHSGTLSDAAVLSVANDNDDAKLVSMLTAVKGIGPWSVHMFMIFSLRRPDVLPAGDLGVRKGVQVLYGLDEVPKPAEMEGLCEKWRPYRSVGAWYMWRLLESKASPQMASSLSS